MRHRGITVPDPEYKRFASAIRAVRQTDRRQAADSAGTLVAREFFNGGCKFQSFPFTIRPRPSRIGRAVYVCICNCVTDRDLVEAAAEFASEAATEDSASFAEQVADRLGAGLGCGTCREFALNLVERAATRGSMVVLPDRAPAPPGLEIPLAERCDLPFQRVTLGNDGAAASQGD